MGVGRRTRDETVKWNKMKYGNELCPQLVEQNMHAARCCIFRPVRKASKHLYPKTDETPVGKHRAVMNSHVQCDQCSEGVNESYEGCSFSDVRRSIEQEAAVRFTYNIYIPSNYSPPLRIHSFSRARHDSKEY